MIYKNTLFVCHLINIYSQFMRPHSPQVVIYITGHDSLICEYRFPGRSVDWKKCTQTQITVITNEKGESIFLLLFTSTYDIWEGSQLGVREKQCEKIAENQPKNVNLGEGLNCISLIRLLFLFWVRAPQPADQSLYICNQQQLLHNWATHGPG